jgi:phosphoribosylcarboxyaminoimidazole (NCAIR) mutase
MPSGIAPMVVLDPGGAALAAAKILGIADEKVHTAVKTAQQEWTNTIVGDDQGIQDG